MTISELKNRLRANPALNVSILLPDGGRIPAHYHITEVGHIAKKFVDCGGTFRASETCVLQTYFGSSRDDGHRLSAGRLAKILDLANPILPSGELPVEVEYEDGVISQYPLADVAVEGGVVTLQLAAKHTDCLAKAKCGVDEGDACEREAKKVEETCCAGTGQGCCS